jgi:hypothetical protein
VMRGVTAPETSLTAAMASSQSKDGIPTLVVTLVPRPLPSLFPLGRNYDLLDILFIFLILIFLHLLFLFLFPLTLFILYRLTLLFFLFYIISNFSFFFGWRLFCSFLMSIFKPVPLTALEPRLLGLEAPLCKTTLTASTTSTSAASISYCQQPLSSHKAAPTPLTFSGGVPSNI